MFNENLAWSVLFLLSVGFACGGPANDGAQGQDTGDTGADEGADDEFELEPGPDGPGCDASWEGQGFWDEGQNRGGVLLAPPEAVSQRGRWHARGTIDGQPRPDVDPVEDPFRATLISDHSVFSTGRHLAVSWCLGSILPNPIGPGPHIDEEKDAHNLGRYSLLRREVERATRMWERHSRMNFVHLVGLDDRRNPAGERATRRSSTCGFGCRLRSASSKSTAKPTPVVETSSIRTMRHSKTPRARIATGGY
jgi:hypothetical protein